MPDTQPDIQPQSIDLPQVVSGFLPDPMVQGVGSVVRNGKPVNDGVSKTQASSPLES